MQRDSMIEGVLHMPSAMLRDMSAVAAALGCDVSGCLARAWALAAAELDVAVVAPARGLLSGVKRPHRFSLAEEAWHAMTEQALRRDRSRSWLAQRAWLLARPRMMAGAG
jgi:hypothetical protein